MFGALGGASLVQYLPQIWLKRAFATLLVYVGVQLLFASEGRKLGAVLPGVIAAAGLWTLYLLRRALGKKTPPPKPPAPPPSDDIDYVI